MIVVMKKGVTEQEIEGVLEHIQTAGFRSNLSRGEQRTIIGVIGDDRQVVDASEYEGLPGVEEVLRVLKPFKLASIDFQPTPTVVTIGQGPGAVRLGAGEKVVVIAGPCAVESREQVMEVAQAARAAGEHVQVDVEDELVGVRVHVHHRPPALVGEAPLLGQLGRGREQVAHGGCILGCDVVQRRDVLLRDDEEVLRRLGLDVLEGERIGVVVDDLRRDLLLDDLAEQAVGHRVLPFRTAARSPAAA